MSATDDPSAVDELTQLWLKFEQEHGLNSSEREEVLSVIGRRDSLKMPEELEHEPPSAAEPKSQVKAAQGELSGDLRGVIDKMRFAERVKLALFGNKQARSILISDKSKVIQQFVLKNARIQIQEIEEFAKNPHMPDIVLRQIGSNREWTRSYSIKRALVFNPKTPADVSMRWLKFINDDDIKLILNSKNLPQVIVSQARKRRNEGAH